MIDDDMNVRLGDLHQVLEQQTAVHREVLSAIQKRPEAIGYHRTELVDATMLVRREAINKQVPDLESCGTVTQLSRLLIRYAAALRPRLRAYSLV